MYLVDKEIKKLIEDKILIDADAAAVDSVACDLHVEYIVGAGNENLMLVELEPGQSAVVAARESVDMANDLIAFVIHKNSRLRMGLQVSAPVYRPGHTTRIFLTVTNTSGTKIEIAKGESIAAIMFDRLHCEPDNIYEGGFQGEDAYRGLGNYSDVWGARIKKIEDKYQSVKDLEKSIYGNVLVIITIFIALFGLLNFEISAVQFISNGFWDILKYNMIYLGSVSLLICMANMILPNKGSKKTLLFIIPAVCILLSIILVCVC